MYRCRGIEWKMEWKMEWKFLVLGGGDGDRGGVGGEWRGGKRREGSWGVVR